MKLPNKQKSQFMFECSIILVLSETTFMRKYSLRAFEYLDYEEKMSLYASYIVNYED